MSAGLKMFNPCDFNFSNDLLCQFSFNSLYQEDDNALNTSEPAPKNRRETVWSESQPILQQEQQLKRINQQLKSY